MNTTSFTEDKQVKELHESYHRSRLRRPLRNKRCNRKYLIDSGPQPKRLFTPEIKKYLKDWLIRRRENPYPNRDEKKLMAMETGLTYVQICNWFANWRRKLKSVGKELNQKTWGHLIKTYNSQVQGNVEHISISSEDSIWQELEAANNSELECAQRFFFQPTPEERKVCVSEESSKISKPSMIFRWLQSATNFKPCEKNYLFYCDVSNKPMMHGCEELDAAETLTALANSSN